MNLGNLFATISLNTAQFTAGLNTVMTETKKFGKQLMTDIGKAETKVFTDAATNAKNAAKQVSGLSAGFKDLGRIVSGIVIAQAFYQVVNALKEGTKAVIEFSSQMEIAEKSFERMFGSKERATGFMEVMKDFAATTEYQVAGTLDLSRRLNAMGFEARQSLSIMKILTDETAFLGGGEAKLERIQYAIGQIKNSAKLAQPEIRQLTEAQVPAIKYLIKGFSITAAQAQNIGKLNISGADAVRAILLGMQEDSAGMAKVIAETTHGMINTIKDDMLLLSQIMIEGMYKAVSGQIRRLRNFLEEVRKLLRGDKKAAEKTDLEKATELITGPKKVMPPYAQPEIGGFAGVMKKLFSPEITQKISIVIGSLFSFFTAIKFISAAMVQILVPAFQMLIGILASVLPPITSFIKMMAQIIYWVVSSIAPIRYLVAAFTGLMIVRFVANTFVFFYSVLRLGSVVLFFTSAIKGLGAAFIFLNTTLTFTSVALTWSIRGFVAVAAIIAGVAIQMNYLSVSSNSLSKTLAYLVAAIIGLLAVTTAIKAFVALSTVFSLTTITAIGATKSIVLFNTATLFVARNVMFLVASIAALVGIFQFFNTEADTVAEKMAKLSKTDYDIFKPGGKEALAKWMEEFNQSIDFSKEGLTGLKDAAGEAAKDIEKSFLASFDEVFNIPETLDDVTDKLAFDPSKFKIPDFPDVFKELQEPIDVDINWGAIPPWLLALLGLLGLLKKFGLPGGTLSDTLPKAVRDRLAERPGAAENIDKEIDKQLKPPEPPEASEVPNQNNNQTQQQPLSRDELNALRDQEYKDRKKHQQELARIEKEATEQRIRDERAARKEATRLAEEAEAERIRQLEEATAKSIKSESDRVAKQAATSKAIEEYRRKKQKTNDDELEAAYKKMEDGFDEAMKSYNETSDHLDNLSEAARKTTEELSKVKNCCGGEGSKGNDTNVTKTDDNNSGLEDAKNVSEIASNLSTTVATIVALTEYFKNKDKGDGGDGGAGGATAKSEETSKAREEIEDPFKDKKTNEINVHMNLVPITQEELKNAFKDIPPEIKVPVVVTPPEPMPEGGFVPFNKTALQMLLEDPYTEVLEYIKSDWKNAILLALGVVASIVVLFFVSEIAAAIGAAWAAGGIIYVAVQAAIARWGVNVMQWMGTIIEQAKQKAIDMSANLNPVNLFSGLFGGKEALKAAEEAGKANANAYTKGLNEGINDIKIIPDVDPNFVGPMMPSQMKYKVYIPEKFKQFAPGYANGGMITREQVIRVGERNKKEAIVPLENSAAVKTFARAIANEMGATGSTEPPIFLSVGTLIGDERSILLLERKLSAVRIKEKQRTGVA